MGDDASAIAAAFGGGLPPGISGTSDRCTVLVSNLDADRIDEDKIFNLFSIYGNIVRIKILRNKPDHALVQMGDGFQAELAVHFLKDVTQEEIVSHLEEHGIIVNTKLFEMNGKKQALVLFEYEEQATEALGLKLATSLGSSTIRISFSQLQTI